MAIADLRLYTNVYALLIECKVTLNCKLSQGLFVRFTVLFIRYVLKHIN
jgi:hypothetical protein